MFKAVVRAEQPAPCNGTFIRALEVLEPDVSVLHPVTVVLQQDRAGEHAVPAAFRLSKPGRFGNARFIVNLVTVPEDRHARVVGFFATAETRCAEDDIVALPGPGGETGVGPGVRYPVNGPGVVPGPNCRCAGVGGRGEAELRRPAVCSQSCPYHALCGLRPTCDRSTEHHAAMQYSE